MHMPGSAGHDELDGRYFTRAGRQFLPMLPEWQARRLPERMFYEQWIVGHGPTNQLEIRSELV
jgi:hypothetical protein